jgi:hypothetical protein
MGYWLGFDSWQEKEIFFHNVQTGSSAQLASCPIGTRGFSPGVKRAEHEVDRPPPSTADLYIHAPIPLHGVAMC